MLRGLLHCNLLADVSQMKLISIFSEESESVIFLGMLQYPLLLQLSLIWVWLFTLHFSTLHSIWIILQYVCLNNVFWNILSKVLWQTAACSFICFGCLFSASADSDFLSPLDGTKKLEPLRAVYLKENGNCFALYSIEKYSNTGEL